MLTFGEPTCFHFALPSQQLEKKVFFLPVSCLFACCCTSTCFLFAVILLLLPSERWLILWYTLCPPSLKKMPRISFASSTMGMIVGGDQCDWWCDLINVIWLMRFDWYAIKCDLMWFSACDAMRCDGMRWGEVTGVGRGHASGRCGGIDEAKRKVEFYIYCMMVWYA